MNEEFDPDNPTHVARLRRLRWVNALILAVLAYAGAILIIEIVNHFR